VICGKEREDRSRLVTALDKHRINNPIIASVKDVQTYLKQHFKINCGQRDNLHVAAEVDPEQYVIDVFLYKQNTCANVYLNYFST